MKNRIAELICTRISHDVMGSIGAVGNASELLEDGDMDFMDDIKSILRTSFENLSSRMKFFRLAFGLDNTNLENAELVEKTAKDYVATIGNKDYPIILQWRDVAPQNVKSALLMLMIMADLILRGGKLDITQKNEFIVAGVAKEIKFSQDKWQRLGNILQNKEEMDANTAPLGALIEAVGSESIHLVDNDEIYGLAVKVSG